MAFSSTLTSLANDIRNDPEIASYLKTAKTPEAETVKAMFADILGEQNADINSSSPILQKMFTFGRTQDFAPTETNILGSLLRPGAGLRNALMDSISALTEKSKVGGDASDNAFMRGFSRPREVPSMSSAIPVQPGASEPQLWANAALGTIGDMGIEPLNAVPIPVGAAVGSAVSRFMPPVAEWAAKNMPALAPNVTRRFNEGLARLMPEQPLAPASTPTPQPPHPTASLDAVGMQDPRIAQDYQTWLAANSGPIDTYSPFASDVPLHPASEGRAAAAMVQPPDATGQHVFPGFDTQQPIVRQRLKETPYEQPIGPMRDPGQQELDFTTLPEAAPELAPSAPTRPPLELLERRYRELIIDGLTSKDYGRHNAEIETLKKAIEDIKGVSGIPKPIGLKGLKGPAGTQFEWRLGDKRNWLTEDSINLKDILSEDTTISTKAASESPDQMHLDFNTSDAPNPIEQSAGKVPSWVEKIAAKDKAREEAIAARVAEFKAKQAAGEQDLPQGQILAGKYAQKLQKTPKKVTPAEELAAEDALAREQASLVPELPQAQQELLDTVKGLDKPTPGEMADMLRVQKQEGRLVQKAQQVLSKLKKQQKAANVAGNTAEVERLQNLIDEGYASLEKPPSLAKDIMTVFKEMYPDSGLSMSMGVPRIKLSETGSAALDRIRTVHAENLRRHIAETGGNVTSYVKSLKLSPDDERMLIHILTKARVANFNASNLSPEKAQVAREVESRTADLRKPASATPLPYEERIGRAGTEEARDVASALTEGEKRNAAAGMDTIAIKMSEKLQRVLDSVDPKERVAALRDAQEAMLEFDKAGTTVARLLESRKHMIASLEDFRAEARKLFEKGDISEADMQSIEGGVDSIHRLPKPAAEKFWGMLHELGINNMLSVMSNLRNISGNTMMAPLAPLTRALQGTINLAARPINKAVAKTGAKFVPFRGADVTVREAGDMLTTYLKNIKQGMRLGGKYFQHESDVGVYRAIEKEMADLEKNTKLSPREKSLKLLKLQEQKKYVRSTLTGSVDSFREAGGLQHRRQIPGEIGKHINTMTRGLSAMDMAFRYPMEKSAEAAIRRRLSIKNNVPLDEVTLTPEMQAEGAEEAAYYTFNQKLGKIGRQLQAFAQPRSALGYAAANVLVFMKNAVNVGKIALDHGALDSGVPLLDATIGPFLNRVTNPGNYGVDTKALAKVAAGLGIYYTSYAVYKKAGWEFFPSVDVLDTKQAEQRRKSKVPTGVFAIDGSGKIHDFSQAQPASLFYHKMAMWDEMKRLAAKGKDPSAADAERLRKQMLSFLDASMLTGSRDIYTAWDKTLKYLDKENRAADEMNPAMAYLSKNAAARLIPAFMDELNRTFGDKVSRDPATAGEYFKQRLPGLSQSIEPKVGYDGKPIERLPSRSPFAEMTVGSGDIKNVNKVDRELLRLGVSPNPVSKTIDGMPTTRAERNSIREEYGPMLEGMLNTIVNSPSYEQMPEFMKASTLESILKVQNVGEKTLKAKKVIADPSGYVQQKMKKITKDRSLSTDNSRSLIFSK